MGKNAIKRHGISSFLLYRVLIIADLEGNKKDGTCFKVPPIKVSRQLLTYFAGDLLLLFLTVFFFFQGVFDLSM